MKSLESKVGALVLEFIDRIKRNDITTDVDINGRCYTASLVEYEDNQYIIDGDGFILIVEFEYTKTESEPEQHGDWFTPSYSAGYEYDITTLKAFVMNEDGVKTPISITKNLDRLTANVVLNLIES